MSRPLTAAADAALDPVRSALLAAAHADAAAVRLKAQRQKDELLADARRTSAGMLAAARTDGQADATAAVAARMADSRREARRTVLAAQRELYDELRRRCRTAATGLAEEPDYAELRQQLVEAARAWLGTDAMVTDSPDGGVVASVGSRRLDLSLPALAERALDRSSVEVTALWTA
ncbi:MULTISPECIES: V-type ATP synthase subunit E family protein [unclassified Kribbella]|uniref:V-type ATP synthase subunit E family protein n=1 Tax=unclassified Kribbella TaxID=2644121 RepID=UPI0030178FA8